MSPVSSPGSRAVSSSRETRGSPARLLVQPAEEPLLGIPGEPLSAEGQREHAPPPLRHRVPSHQGADRSLVAHAGLDHETRRRERPAADARARSSPARVRQLLRARPRCPPARPPRGRSPGRAWCPIPAPCAAGSPRAHPPRRHPRCPKAARARRANAVARSACDPCADDLPAGPGPDRPRRPAETPRPRRTPRSGALRCRPDRASRSAAAPAR